MSDNNLAAFHVRAAELAAADLHAWLHRLTFTADSARLAPPSPALAR
jgi:hypothetical protein